MSTISDQTYKYDILEPLGKGTSGAVYMAKRRGKVTALKLVPTSHRQNAFAEVAALERLSSHRNVITMNYCSLDREKNTWFLELELCRGGDLLSAVSKGALTEELARPLAFDVLSALAHAHENDFCHRDIKLENVLLVDEQRTSAVLADWGLSVQMRPQQRLTKDCGSLHYASPEILASRPYEGDATDIWSTGILLFAMVTGCFPFVGSSARERLTDILSRKSLPLPSSLSSELCDLISRMLVVDGRQRLSAAEALHHPWFDPLFPAEASMDDDDAAKVSSTCPAHAFQSIVKKGKKHVSKKLSK